MYEHLRVEEKNGVINARLDRPARLNALNPKLLEELCDFFNSLYWRRDVRVVILSGAGDNFCAGLDLKEPLGFPDPSTGNALTKQRRVSEIVIAMRRCPQPIIALIQGAASGGGFAIALASDVRIATPDARMNVAFVRIGLSGCDMGVSYFLPRMVGSSVAAELALTGRFLDAQRAVQLGLVSRIVETGVLQAEADTLAGEMLHASPLGLRLTKEALNHAIDAQGLEAVVAMEDRNQILCAQSSEFAEGVAAFREKRAPRYTGTS